MTFTGGWGLNPSGNLYDEMMGNPVAVRPQPMSWRDLFGAAIGRDGIVRYEDDSLMQYESLKAQK